jgi:hypothetical protein
MRELAWFALSAQVVIAERLPVAFKQGSLAWAPFLAPPSLGRHL